MAISLASIKHGISYQPPILLIFGDHGIGKDTFASSAPDPVFLFTENSLGMLDVPRFSFNNDGEAERIVAASYEEIMMGLNALLTEPHNYKTAVISTLDWMEPLIWDYLVRQNPSTESGKPASNVESYGYGKGYKLAIEYWTEFLAMLTRLRTERDMAIILTGHYTKEKITPPDGASYESYTPKLQNSDKISARDKVVEYCDVVLFANWRVATTTEADGKDKTKTRNRGVGSGERIVYTEQRPAWEAKNRFSLPAEIRVQHKQWNDVWQILAEHIPWFSKFTNEPAANGQAQAAQPVQNQTQGA